MSIESWDDLLKVVEDMARERRQLATLKGEIKVPAKALKSKVRPRHRPAGPKVALRAPQGGPDLVARH